MRSALRALPLALLVLSASICAQAQLSQESEKAPPAMATGISSVRHGDLALGFVVADPTGAVIPDANVYVTQEETGATFSGRTNSAGAYRMPDLAAGTYVVRVEHRGFRAQNTRIRLRNDLDDRVTIVLDVAQDCVLRATGQELPTTTSSLDSELLPEPTQVDEPRPPSPASKPNPIKRFFSAVGHKLGI